MRFTIKEPIFNSTLTVFYGTDQKDAHNYFLRQNGYIRTDEEIGRCNGCTFIYKRNHVIWLKDKVSHGVIAHECLHAINATLKDCGITMEDSTDEIFTHFLAFYVDRIIDKIQKK